MKRGDLAKKKRSFSAPEESEEELFDEPNSSQTPDLVREIHAMKKSIDSIVQGRNSPSVSGAFRRVITDTFSCHVCRSILKPPVIFAKCCHYILGCQQCVETWYRGDEGRNKRCPRCRADRGSAETCQLYGLDEFLGSITQLLADTQEE